MPWPKGKPHSSETIAARAATLRRTGIRHKKPNEAGHWRCGKCRTWKAGSEFYCDKRTPSGLKSHCKPCHLAICISSRDPEAARATKRRSEAVRRARKAGARGKVSKESLQKLADRFGQLCLKCGSQDKLQWDHVVPLAKDGMHCITNLQRLCRSCNEIKYARTADYRSEDQNIWVIDFKLKG